jgi:hypothetical protein
MRTVPKAIINIEKWSGDIEPISVILCCKLCREVFGAGQEQLEEFLLCESKNWLSGPFLGT